MPIMIEELQRRPHPVHLSRPLAITSERAVGDEYGETEWLVEDKDK